MFLNHLFIYNKILCYSGSLRVFGGIPGDSISGIPGPRVGYMPQVQFNRYKWWIYATDKIYWILDVDIWHRYSILDTSGGYIPQIKYIGYQEIHRPGTAISVYCGGRRSKQRTQGQRIIFEGKGPKGWNKNILLLYFIYWLESQISYEFALTWYINLFFFGLKYHVVGYLVCLHFSHSVKYTICVYLNWAFHVYSSLLDIRRGMWIYDRYSIMDTSGGYMPQD